MFCLHFYLFIYLFLFAILKKRVQNWQRPVKETKKRKTICGIFFILFSWAEIEPSHCATELRSRAKTISSSEPLSHWAAIRVIEPWSDQAKSRFTSSQNPSHRASEPRYVPSRVEPRYLSYSYVNKLKGFIKITPWVWGRMLRNPK